MRKLLILLLILTSTIQAQYAIKGTMTPPEKSDWVALYKIDGAKQKFIKHTTIKMSEVTIDDETQKIGSFEFELPKQAKIGSYRISFGEDNSGFIDFFFNEEDIEMIFNPKYPDQSMVFTKSLENRVYLEYTDAHTLIQQRVDSIQEEYFKFDDEDLRKAYKKELSILIETQKTYEKKSGGMYVNTFIKSSKTTNPSNPFEDKNKYREYAMKNFFRHVNFKDEKVTNSPFIINKISDYIFFLNTGDTQNIQQKLYKESIKKVMGLTRSNQLKLTFSEFLITTFTNKRNSEIVDWMFSKFYDKLPRDLKSNEFKSKKLKALKVSVGRIAPDFSWKENGKKMELSKLNDGKEYLLIFWSTQCSHCVIEIPEVHEYMKTQKDVSVVAFAIEDDDIDFSSWSKNKLYNFHNAIGTNPGGNKYENETVRDYLIDATPTYFILDKNKNIINIPNEAKDVKDYFNARP